MQKKLEKKRITCKDGNKFNKLSTLSQSSLVLFNTRLFNFPIEHSKGGSTGPNKRLKLKLTNSTRGICANIFKTSFQFCNLFCAKSNSFTEQHFFLRSSASPARSISQSLRTRSSGTLEIYTHEIVN